MKRRNSLPGFHEIATGVLGVIKAYFVFWTLVKDPGGAEVMLLMSQMLIAVSSFEELWPAASWLGSSLFQDRILSECILLGTLKYPKFLKF